MRPKKSNITPHLNWFQPTAAVKKALQEVESGSVLSDDRRRKCVRFLSTVDIYTNEELSSLFNVTVDVIANDMSLIIHERNEVIGSISPVDFIAEYLENQKYAINKMKGEIEFGTLNSADKIKALEKYSIALARLLESMQSLGALPKELGHLSVVEEKWVANITEGGLVNIEQQIPLKELQEKINEQDVQGSSIQEGVSEIFQETEEEITEKKT
jgi:hypothetical protein